MSSLFTLLAVKLGKRRCRIALAGCSVPRHSACECGKVFGEELHIERAKGLGETISPPSTNERHDVFALRGDPRNCDLRHRGADLLGKASQLLHQRKIYVEVGALETRSVGTEVALAGTRLGPMPADQPAR